MFRFFPWLLAFACSMAPALAQGEAEAGIEGQSIHGWEEEVVLMPEGIRLKAKMDTGATSSSLNALNKEIFQRDGDEWIAFDIIDPEDEDNKVRLERKIVRHVRIIRHDGNHQRRPVVSMELCLGRHRRDADVSLVDRTELSYQVLVGRNHMKDIIVVDSGRKNLQPPRCDE
jgi:hypothetical protein